MRWLLQFVLGLAVVLITIESPAPDFKMADGSVVTGELVAPNDDGVVVRRSSGGLTSRLPWDRFSQETLTEMSKEENLKELVQAFIDIPESAESEKPPLVIKEPAGKVERPEKRPGLFSALFSTQAGMFILLVFMIGNLYVAYEVAVYRNYPAAAVIGASVILPALGPILFLCMPTRVRDDVVLESQFEAPQEVQNTGGQELAAAGLAGSGLSLSAGKQPAAAATAQPAVYKRGDVEFNRQFFERTFPLFFRVSRTDSDKDQVLVIKSHKGEVIGTRITRISASEMGVATLKGHEVQVRFGEVSEVQLRSRPA
ncbi:MAG: hypothetical protein AB7O66_17765 [Limisphaerales bacterium]